MLTYEAITPVVISVQRSAPVFSSVGTMKVIHLVLFAATLLLQLDNVAAQENPIDTSTYKVHATSGEFPYYPEVGLETFEYSVDMYCDYCVIRIGGFTMPGQYTGGMFDRACEAKMYLSNGESLRVVSTSGGHLEVHDGRSNSLLVRFSASFMKPPADADVRQLEEYVMMCYEMGMYPQF